MTTFERATLRQDIASRKSRQLRGGRASYLGDAYAELVVVHQEPRPPVLTPRAVVVQPGELERCCQNCGGFHSEAR